MKKISLILAIAASIFAAALPSSAQTVPVLSGKVNLNLNAYSTILNLSSSTILTPIGAVNINANGFNGSLTNTSLSITNVLTSSVPNDSSNYVNWSYSRRTGPNQFQFVGTTNGTSPNGAFTNAATTIKFQASITGGPNPPGIFAATATGGSITLPAPPPVVVVPPPVTCTGCLIVRPDLRIANSTFLSPDFQEPEYRQEYKNDFSTSSFRGGRILGLEDK